MDDMDVLVKPGYMHDTVNDKKMDLIPTDQYYSGKNTNFWILKNVYEFGSPN